VTACRITGPTETIGAACESAQTNRCERIRAVKRFEVKSLAPTSVPFFTEMRELVEALVSSAIP
jgi:hypothetical protein